MGGLGGSSGSGLGRGGCGCGKGPGLGGLGLGFGLGVSREEYCVRMVNCVRSRKSLQLGDTLESLVQLFYRIVPHRLTLQSGRPSASGGKQDPVMRARVPGGCHDVERPSIGIIAVL